MVQTTSPVAVTTIATHDGREQEQQQADGCRGGPGVEDQHRVQVGVPHVEQAVVQVLAVGAERRLARAQATEDRQREVEQRHDAAPRTAAGSG